MRYVQDVVTNVVKILHTLKKDKHQTNIYPKRRLAGCLVSGEEGSDRRNEKREIKTINPTKKGKYRL